MNELDIARTEINEIDNEMAVLFERRMNACAKIAAYKKDSGLSVRDKAREESLINASRKNIENGEIEEYYVRFLQNTIDLSCQYQSRLMSGMKVTYCGVEGAFGYAAAKRMFPSAELVAFGEFSDAYNAVETGEADCAVLPIENSYAGEVGAVMDIMFSGGLFVNQVMDLPVAHSLIAVKGARAEDIKTVVSHPQALAQCGEYIRKKGYETKVFSNTALAVKYIKELNDPSVAAIAAEENAALYGLELVDTDINDSQNNTTRFAAFSRAQNRPVSTSKRADEHFILVFTVQNEAGALAKTLNIIGAHGFNMRNLRSRPMKDLQWNYFFYIEAEGNINTENGSDMLRELSAICAKLKLVGTYYSELNTGDCK